MLAHERRAQMVRLLRSNEGATVREMALLLGVTTETVRRDLRVLEDHGIVERVHGGARLRDEGEAALPVAARRTLHIAEKIAIAVAALQFIQDGEAISLDSSTTALQLARRLGSHHISVVTYSLDTARELSRFPHLHIHVTGGVLHHPEGVLVGRESIDALKRLRVKTAFVSCAGVDANGGLMISSSLEADVKKALVRSADEVCLLADSSKFGRRGLVPFAELTNIHTVITDDAIAPKHIGMLQEHDIDVIVAVGPEKASPVAPIRKGVD